MVGPSAPPKPGGAATLFGGASPPTQTLHYRDTYTTVPQTPTHPPLPRHRNKPRATLRWRSVALRWRNRKPREATKTTAPPAPPKREDLRGFEVEKALSRQKEPQWSLSGGAGGAPPVATWLVGYPDRVGGQEKTTASGQNGISKGTSKERDGMSKNRLLPV